MSRLPARLAPALTIAACTLVVACTPSEKGKGQADDEQPQLAANESGPAEVEPAAEAGAEGAEAAAEAGAEGAETEGAETGGEPEGPPQPPEDYGLLKIDGGKPDAEAVPLYGLAGYEVVAVYEEPSKESTKLGFLRIGTRMRVGEAVKTEDCAKGWHQLETGGYACASRGLVVDKRDPYMAYQPSKARLDEPFPYEWAYVRKWNTPMWWRVPTAEEYKVTHEKRAILESERTGEPLPSEEPKPKPKPAGEGGESAPEGEGGEDGVANLPAPETIEDGPPAIIEDGAPDPGASDPPPAVEPEPEEEEEPISLPLSPAHPWLEKGYFLSLGESMREEGRGYWRTARGGVVEKSMAFPYTPKDYQGGVLTEDMSFPVGFVMVKNGTRMLRLGDDNKLHATGKKLDKRTFLDLGEEVEINGHTYFTVIPHDEDGKDDGKADGKAEAEGEEPAEQAPEDQLLVKKDVIRTPEIQPMPKGLKPYDRWIDVDISKQMLVAYEGSRPVYVTLVSTGKKGTDEEPFETPTGRYRVYSKQVTSNMDGTTATDGNYAIQDVPWVMYFEGSYALHGAFWHRSFGYVRSHGCVNLGPSDARWLFNWTTPFLPEGWHGVRSSDDNPGTTVVVRRSEES